MERHWLVTWTTYGTWLPGDARGSTSDVRNQEWQKGRENRVGEQPVGSIPALNAFAAGRMQSDPVRLVRVQAEDVIAQFQETFRGWALVAVAVMSNHIHLVVGVPDDPDPDHLLRDFESYASRRLNRAFGRRERWWTEGGSTRKLQHDSAVQDAVEYVKNQEYPLVIWTA